MIVIDFAPFLHYYRHFRSLDMPPKRAREISVSMGFTDLKKRNEIPK